MEEGAEERIFIFSCLHFYSPSRTKLPQTDGVDCDMTWVMWQLPYGGPPHGGGKKEEDGSEGETIERPQSYAEEILRLLKEGILKYPIGKR